MEVLDLILTVLCPSLVVFLVFLVLFSSLRELRRAIDILSVSHREQRVPSGSSQPETTLGAVASTGTILTGKRCVKEPQVFHGNSTEFKEWSFGISLALDSLELGSPEREVNYAASFLAGNARLWFISSREAGEQFRSWPALREALACVYGPRYSKELARLKLFSVSCQGSIDTYISEFTRWSLQVPELDEHSRALLFVHGLRGNMRSEVLKEHPTTLSRAIEAALSVSADDPHRPIPEYWRRAKLSPEEREKLRSERGCFACRQPGHMARNCPQSVQHPNVKRQ